MKKRIKIISLTVAIVFIFTGCASYRAVALNNLSPDMVIVRSTTKDNVRIVAKEFSQADCKRYLDRNVIAKGYQPVQLCIENDSDNNYFFSLNRVSLLTASPDDVALRVHTSTFARSAGYGVASLLCWPFIIPAIVDGIKSYEANEALDNDFYSKSARDCVVSPHSRTNMILFVPRHAYNPKFTVTMVNDVTNESRIFNVTATRS